MSDMIDKIQKLKEEAISRCADRIAEAKKNKKKTGLQDFGITANLKRKWL